MAESSEDKQTYERKIVQRFGGQQEFNFIFSRHRPHPSMFAAAAPASG
jgi:hypothetical protein